MLSVGVARDIQILCAPLSLSQIPTDRRTTSSTSCGVCRWTFTSVCVLKKEEKKKIPQTRKEINVVRRRLLCMVCFLPKNNCVQQRTGRPTIRRGYWDTVADRGISCLLSVHLRPNDNLIRWRNNLFYSNSVEARIRPLPFIPFLPPYHPPSSTCDRVWVAILGVSGRREYHCK